MLPSAKRSQLLADLTEQEIESLEYDWRFWARANQIPPSGEWTAWLILAGRGFGKSRTGAEAVREEAFNNPTARIALIGSTSADARDTMVEGESGILAISPLWFRPIYEPSKRRLMWPNGAQATTFSAEEPDRLRGPQHTFAWADELCAWKYAQETWDMLQFGLRLGQNPRSIITTTPKPIKVLKDIIAEPGTVVTKGSTLENEANLAPSFLSKIVGKYEGTRLGRQELEAEILEDTQGALWKRGDIEALRLKASDPLPEFTRVVVAIDPAVSNNEGSDETGIVAVGLGKDGHGYVLEDASGQYAPNKWAEEAIALYRRWKADRIIGEVNNGGDMVETTIRAVDLNVSYKAVHASRGKVTRAEPVSALYEQKRIHHVGAFATLEDQMCQFTSDFDRKTSGYSPDRVDALVWAIKELMLGEDTTGIIRYYEGMVKEQEARRADAGTKELPTVAKGGVVLKAPKGTSTVYDQLGRRINVDADGTVTVDKETAKALCRAGFTHAT